jgi:hypothetical protein
VCVSSSPNKHFFALFLSLFKILLYLCIQKHQLLGTVYETDKNLDIPDGDGRRVDGSLQQ